MDLFKCGHEKSTENSYFDNRGYSRCKLCALSPANRAKRAEYMRERKEDNARRQTEYRARHVDRIRDARKIRYSVNIETERARGARRRARKRGATLGDSFTAIDVLSRYGTDCHICKEPIDLDAPRKPPGIGWQRGLNIDHLISLAGGGKHTLENCRPSHALCNLRKGAR